MKRFSFVLSAVTLALASMSTAQASSVAIVQGGWYTSDLKNVLNANGVSVTEISSYTAATLSPFDAVIHYGNSFTDTTALNSYVSSGGTLVLTPWAGLNFSVPASMQVFADGGSAVFSQSFPGVNVLAPSDPLLNGVSIPAAGGFNVGRIDNIDFVSGATQVLDWADGDGLLGYRSVGSGTVVGLNLHVITSDTAYTAINQPWVTQLMLNIVDAAPATAVPEPASMALVGVGLFGVLMSRRRKTA